MPIFRFRTLWENHPTIKGDAPLLDKATYPNQCAINMSAAFIRSGISMDDFSGAKSWQKDKPKYAIRAQELANWLNLRPRTPGKSCVKISAKDFGEKISNQSGIIFFQNYWGPGSQGDHIDLWNGSRLTDWFTWVRIHARVGSYGVHSIMPVSDFQKSQSIWFWSIS